MRESAVNMAAMAGPGMSEESTEISPAVSPAKSRPSGLRPPWRPGESGNPHGREVRAVKLFEQMATDFGELSAVDSALLLQACRLMARSERAAGAIDAVRLANASARLLATLRNARRKPGLVDDLADHIAKLETRAADAEAAS
jgi:hypothetical protein